MPFSKVVKISVFLKKKDDTSDQQFSEYYAQKHAALAGPVLLRHNCISYTQVRVASSTVHIRLFPRARADNSFIIRITDSSTA